MNGMTQQFHDATVQKDGGEVMFRTWREWKMMQIVNQQLTEREKWASEEKEKRRL
jgi:hypothetical protein